MIFFLLNPRGVDREASAMKIPPRVKNLVMRVSYAYMIILICSLQLTAKDGNGQNLEKVSVTVELQNEKLHKLIEQVEAQTSFLFVVATEVVDPYTITIPKGTRNLKETLDLAVANTGLQYFQKDNYIAFAERKKETPLLVSVTGKVISAIDKSPLAGVNVVVKGTTSGTTTDAEGIYTIEANATDILTFTFIGYKNFDVAIGNQTNINVSLEEDAKSLGEVTVYSSGYSKIPVERSTGSYSQLDNELVNRNVSTDVISRLNGLTPSLQIDNRSGSPVLSIRGRSTIMANDQPLIVVDNFPYAGDLNTINPNDIETITVLRDAAAASIWGVRAGNGVIVITTKKGKRNQPLRVNINSNVTIGDKPDLFYERRISTSDFIDVEKMLYDSSYFDGMFENDSYLPNSPLIELLHRQSNGEVSQAEVDAQINAWRNQDVRNDLLKHFYRKSVNQQYSISLNGGSDKSSYFFSAGLDDNRSNQVGVGYKRVTVNSQNTFSLTKNLELSAGIVYTKSENENNNTLAYLRMGGRKIYPYAKFTDDEGNPIDITQDYRPAFLDQTESQGFLNWKFNPIKELGLSDNTTQIDNLRLNGGLKYTIIDGLDVDVKFQHQTEIGSGRDFRSVDTYITRDLINGFSLYDGNAITRAIPLGGILDMGDTRMNANSGRAQIDYERNWHKHDISALAGFEVRQTVAEGHSSLLYGYDDDLGSSLAVDPISYYPTSPSGEYRKIPITGLSTNFTIDRFRSYFANAAYTFDGRYTVSASSRLDQSNLFGVNSNQKSTPLWSIGGKWNLGKESFYSKELPRLILRATYGFNGNMDQNATAFTTAYFASSDLTSRNSAVIRTPPNPYLKWEKSRMFNLALDFNTPSSRISGSVEYYIKKGIDLFGFGPLNPTTGLSEFKGNVASMKGNGIDVIIRSINLDQVIKWNTELLFSYSTDEVTKYDLITSRYGDFLQDASVGRSQSAISPKVGRPLFGIYSFRSAGLDPNTGDPRGYVNGEASLDYETILSVATIDSLAYNGRATPPIFGAIRNTFSLKGITFSFNFIYKLGYYFRRTSINYTDLYSTYTGHSDIAARWKIPGDQDHTSVPSLTYPSNLNRDSFYSLTEGLVQKGDNIRLQDIQISYNFGALKLGKVSLTQAQLYCYINNIGIIWSANKSGLDPDFSNLPAPRTYSFGIRFGF